MKILGWVIWGLGCLILLGGISRLRKPRGRLRRCFFCLVTAAGLALTCFTPLSKFHLLWILPLQMILGLLGFGLLAGGALTYHKLTARKPEKTDLPAGSFPPFGALRWNDGDWEGKLQLPSWGGFQSRGGPYGSEDSKSPSNGSVTVSVKPGQKAEQLEPAAEQCRAIEFQLQHGDEVVESVLNALLPKYPEWKKDWEMDDEQMPPISGTADFRRMMGLSQVHVLPHVSDGLAYIGLEFGCDWEEEHGLGVVLHGKRVVEVGAACDAFCWSPPDGDGENSAGSNG